MEPNQKTCKGCKNTRFIEDRWSGGRCNVCQEKNILTGRWVLKKEYEIGNYKMKIKINKSTVSIFIIVALCLLSLGQFLKISKQQKVIYQKETFRSIISEENTKLWDFYYDVLDGDGKWKDPF